MPSKTDRESRQERREERRGEERDGEESEVMSVSMVNDTNNEY